MINSFLIAQQRAALTTLSGHQMTMDIEFSGDEWVFRSIIESQHYKMNVNVILSNMIIATVFAIHPHIGENVSQKSDFYQINLNGS